MATGNGCNVDFTIILWHSTDGKLKLSAGRGREGGGGGGREGEGGGGGREGEGGKGVNISVFSSVLHSLLSDNTGHDSPILLCRTASMRPLCSPSSNTCLQTIVDGTAT